MDWGQPNKILFHPPIKTKWLEEKKTKMGLGNASYQKVYFKGLEVPSGVIR